MESSKELVPKCFVTYEGCPLFALPPFQRIHAADYLKALLKEAIKWHEAEEQLREYAVAQKWEENYVEAQLKVAEALLKPWLE
jgi:hypothetical protein